MQEIIMYLFKWERPMSQSLYQIFGEENVREKIGKIYKDHRGGKTTVVCEVDKKLADYLENIGCDCTRHLTSDELRNILEKAKTESSAIISSAENLIRKTN